MYDKYQRLYYPYTINGRTEYLVVRDITTNARYLKDAVTNGAIYNIVDLEDGDTPERVANQFYDNPELFHTVMLANELYDIKNDFPLAQSALEAMIADKYANPFGVHHYEDVYGNIIQETSIEMRPFIINIDCVDAGKQPGETGYNLCRTIQHQHYASDEYSYDAPMFFNKYPNIDVIRGTMGDANRHITIKYEERCIAFTLHDDEEVLVDTGVDGDNRFVKLPINLMRNANLFPTFKGEVPDGMLSVWIRHKNESEFTEQKDMSWDNITAFGGDSVEIRTTSGWTPVPCFGPYSFATIDKRFPQLRSDPNTPATDLSKMFYPMDANGKMVGCPLRRVPSRLFDANPQVTNVSHMFAACLDIEFTNNPKPGEDKCGIPRDILMPFERLRKADHFAQCVSVPLTLYISSPFLEPTDNDIDSDFDIKKMNEDGTIEYKDIHTDAWQSGVEYGALEGFFNEVPWKKTITNTVYVLKQAKSTSYNAFVQQSVHLTKTRQDKINQNKGFSSLNVYAIETLPEIRKIGDAIPYTADEVDQDEINYKAMHIIPVTNRDYEIRLNDEKRRIAIIRPDMIEQAERALESALEES